MSGAARHHAGELHVGFALLNVRGGLFERSLGLFYGGLGLRHLIGKLGRIDFGQRLAGLHAVANIHQALLDVSVRARQHRRFGNGLDIAGQLQTGLPGGPAHLDDFDAW